MKKLQVIAPKLKQLLRRFISSRSPTYEDFFFTKLFFLRFSVSHTELTDSFLILNLELLIIFPTTSTLTLSHIRKYLYSIQIKLFSCILIRLFNSFPYFSNLLLLSILKYQSIIALLGATGIVRQKGLKMIGNYCNSLLVPSKIIIYKYIRIEFTDKYLKYKANLFVRCFFFFLFFSLFLLVTILDSDLLSDINYIFFECSSMTFECECINTFF